MQRKVPHLEKAQASVAQNIPLGQYAKFVIIVDFTGSFGIRELDIMLMLDKVNKYLCGPIFNYDFNILYFWYSRHHRW